MTKASSGTATTILAPATAGDYKLFVIDAAGNISNASAATLTVDNTAPTFTIQYYSDSGLSSSLGDSPRLKAGTYYLKITANEALSGAPTISINAEGTANDVTGFAATLVSGNSYKYTRTIGFDTAAVGSVLENISITGSDVAGNTATNVDPSNEATKAAYTDTTAPTAAITYSPAGPYKSGPVVTITATFSEAMADTPKPQIAISGANTLASTNMTKTDSTHYYYVFTVGAGDGTATVALSTGTDLAGNVVTAAPTSGATFTVDNTAPTNQDTVFAASVTKKGGATVTIVSSGDATNSVWFAPAGTTTFAEGATMTKASSGTATSILAEVDPEI